MSYIVVIISLWVVWGVVRWSLGRYWNDEEKLIWNLALGIGVLLTAIIGLS